MRYMLLIFSIQCLLPFIVCLCLWFFFFFLLLFFQEYFSYVVAVIGKLDIFPLM